MEDMVKRATVGGLLSIVMDDASAAVVKLWPQEWEVLFDKSMASIQ